jgi:hypothetical protein
MWYENTFGMSVYSKEYTFPILFGVLNALLWAKNTLWARTCLSVCLSHFLVRGRQIRSSRPQEDRDCPPKDFTTHRARPLPGTAPLGDTPRQSPPHLVLTGIFINPYGFRPGPSPGCSVGPGPQWLLLQGLYPMHQLTTALATRTGHPCAPTILVATLFQE